MPMTAVEDTATFVATNQGGAVGPSGVAGHPRRRLPGWRHDIQQPIRAGPGGCKGAVPEKPDPGILVSCGAGTEKPSRARSHDMTNISRTAGGRVEKRRRARPWSRWKLSSVGRVFGAFMSQNNSNREFERVRQHAVHRENFFRLDFEHDGPQPALDDVTDLKGRQSWAEETAARSPNIDALALCIRAQHFYFELDDEPVADAIAGRARPTRGKLSARRSESFGEFLGRDARGHDSVVVKNVTFSVDTKRTNFSIEVCEGENRPYGISGSPFTVDWLVQAQGLDDYFGGGY
ncbi:hypothetical protein BM221_010513 [Beauveria bassiana]|nr:hypothetical protein BM221_010513 [Beauveria bassiana]